MFVSYLLCAYSVVVADDRCFARSGNFTDLSRANSYRLSYWVVTRYIGQLVCACDIVSSKHTVGLLLGKNLVLWDILVFQYIELQLVQCEYNNKVARLNPQLV